MNRKKLRNAFRTVHLWLGLGSGIVIFVVCLSGTVYTFRAEIERWLEPEKFYAKHPGASQLMSADSMITLIEKKYQGTVSSLSVPAGNDMNWQVSVKKGKGKPKTYFVNPYNGEVAGEQGGSTSDFFSTVMKLHRWLLMEQSTGRVIVGTATIIMFFMLLTGLILWFPAQLRYIKQGLKIKFSGNWKRLNHDLHNVLGFYAFLVLMIMTLTGLCWSFEWYRNGASNVLGAQVFKGRGEKPLKSQSTGRTQEATIANLLLQANTLFPYDGGSRVTIPEEEGDALTVVKSATGFFAVAGADKAQFDYFTGKPLKVERFSDKALNVQVASSIKLLHTGEMFGTASKIIYFLACLIATSLPVTGTFIWINKFRKKKKAVKSTERFTREFA